MDQNCLDRKAIEEVIYISKFYSKWSKIGNKEHTGPYWIYISLWLVQLSLQLKYNFLEYKKHFDKVRNGKH